MRDIYKIVTLIAFSCYHLPTAAANQAVKKLEAFSLEELVNVEITSASKTAETTEHAAATVYVITEEHIRKLGLRDLKDVLAIVPGVDTIDNHFFLQGGQRGFMGPFSQSLILVNGREMNNLIAGETFIANQFRTYNIKQIEVIAGPASALYGANAVGGIINLITKTPEQINGTEIALFNGSFNSRGVDFNFGKVIKDWKLNVAISYYRSDEQDFSNFLSNTQLASPAAENNLYRRLPNQYGYANDSYALPISLYVEKAGFYIGSEYYRNLSGRGTASIQWDYNQSSDFRELWMKYGGYQAKGLLDGQLDMRLEYRNYWERFWGNHTESTGPLENPFTGERLTDRVTWEDIEAYRGAYSNRDSRGSRKHFAMLEGIYHWNKTDSSVVGIDYDNSDIVSAAWSRTAGDHPALSEDNFRPEFRNHKWGVYAQYEGQLGKPLFLTVGARLVKHQRYGQKFLPRVGFVYSPLEGTSLKALYGQSFREPSVFELSSNTNIRPMTVDTRELSWHQYLGEHFKNEAVIFFNDAKDLIVSDNITAISNHGKLESQGFEDVLHFKYQQLTGFLNYTYMDTVKTTNLETTSQVYDIPRHKANLAVMYNFSPDHSLGLLGRYRSRVQTEYQNQLYTIKDYLIWDLTWSKNDLAWLGKETHLALTIKNIFDRDYYQPEPRDANILQHPQEGRSIWLRLQTTLK